MIIPARFHAALAFLDWSRKVRLQTIIVSRALPRTFSRVRNEDAAEVDAALGLFSGEYTGLWSKVSAQAAVSREKD
jgi:hypothetical protein